VCLEPDFWVVGLAYVERKFCARVDKSVDSDLSFQVSYFNTETVKGKGEYFGM